jgi:hypothetical protein
LDLWFVYRSHYEGPLSRRIRRLNAPSLLAWFQSRIEKARSAPEPSETVDEELGGYVYGLGSLFEAVVEHSLPPPRSLAELKALLDEHLYVEGEFVIDEHSLRVLTDDDEVALAYFFFDETAPRDRVAFLFQEDPRLPDGDAPGPFEPPLEVAPLLPAGAGGGATWACLFTFYDGDSIPGTVGVFPGVRLPQLASHLRSVIPHSQPTDWSEDWLETWPLELRLLRAQLAPDDQRLSPALERCAAYPLVELGGTRLGNRFGLLPHAAAREEVAKAESGLAHRGDRGQSIVHEGDHVAVLCAHTSRHFGFQQWILFDDRWAAAQPALAASILRYAKSWDPFA